METNIEYLLVMPKDKFIIGDHVYIIKKTGIYGTHYKKIVTIQEFIKLKLGISFKKVLCDSIDIHSIYKIEEIKGSHYKCIETKF